MRNVLLAAAAIGLLATGAASAQSFTFTTLDNPGDPTFNQLLGINDSGVIVGYFGSGAQGHPNIGYEISPPYTKYSANMMPGSVQTQATGINNAGLTTGFWAPTNTGMDANFGFVRVPDSSKFTYTSVTDPAEAAPLQADQALGINNNNVVAGFYADVNGNAHPFTYSMQTGEYSTFQLGGAVSSFATGINDNGDVCGYYLGVKGHSVGFVRGNGILSKFSVPGSTFTQLFGINNGGVAVGAYVDSSGLSHGLYYVPGTGAWLAVDDPEGVQGTFLNGINNKGEIVGFYVDAAGNTHGMIVTVSQ
jgi:hypothetical protein